MGIKILGKYGGLDSVKLCTVLDIDFDKNQSLKHVLLPAILGINCLFHSHFLSANHETSSSSSSMAWNWQHSQTNMCAYILHFILHLTEKKSYKLKTAQTFKLYRFCGFHSYPQFVNTDGGSQASNLV